MTRHRVGTRWWIVVATFAAVVGCTSPTNPDLNNPTLQGATGSPTPATVKALAQGLLFGTRTEMPNFIFMDGTLGREGYCLCNNEPRFISELLIGPIDPGSIGGDIFLWRNPYKNIRSANLLLHAVAAVPGFTDAERSATVGFAETIQANDFLQVLNARDSAGIPMAVDQDPSAPPAPIKLAPAALDSIAKLLDEADTKLAAGSDAFPFQLTTGFAGFDTPATFRQVNRALRARVAIYQMDFSTALTVLASSFLSTTAPLTLGAYHVYTTNPGDALNPLYDPSATQYFAHPSFVTDAQTRSDGSPDLRVAAKVKVVTPHTLEGVTSDLSIIVYDSPTAPIPIIRNAELILLRAEANIALGNRAAAITDINIVRVQDGGLAPLDASFSGDLLDELLYEKRYSLFWEDGHRLVDWRRYGKLLQLPRDLPTHKIISHFPIPQAECLPRNPQPAGCAAVAGQ